VPLLSERSRAEKMIHSVNIHLYALTPARTLCKLRLSHSGV
jgi:hypothetical protein